MFRVVNFILAVIFCQWSPVNGFKATLPTLYEHYTQGGISSGLTTYPEGFLLNGKNITIVSGAIHYFRVHPEYWRARLRQLRAAGFVAVETYIPWNLHEPRSGEYDFGEGDNDFSLFLDFVKYLKVAQEEDLLAIVRPGPWIAAEWENGGLPSWLLRDPNLRPRHSNRPFIYYMNRFYDKVFPILRRLQFTEGGPIIAFQIENEYGLVGKGGSHPDTAYLQEIYQEMVKHNLTALKFTMDAPFNSYKNGSLPGVLMTANFQTDPVGQLKELKKLQPDQPLWVIESYPGWFDSWFDSQHYTMSTQASIDMTRAILEMSSSINLYMFHGGTTFGFMNGAIPNAHTPTIKFHVNSYDYDAPVTEAGDYTQKYNATAELVKQFLAVDTKLPQRPPESVKQAYGTVSYTGQLTVSQLIDQVRHLATMAVCRSPARTECGRRTWSPWSCWTSTAAAARATASSCTGGRVWRSPAARCSRSLDTCTTWPWCWWTESARLRPSRVFDKSASLDVGSWAMGVLHWTQRAVARTKPWTYWWRTWGGG
ncbi:beta-galactosidase-1-like protein 3 isoform X2 [Bacillus rossius redtenbacheri]|uniref:beta-galactosidase-1-like protein 3 isoform X2 n=1 Tax=Bacillus rossius redtenbacheri TaxID=93214 RepID=UPI002FDCD1D2